MGAEASSLKKRTKRNRQNEILREVDETADAPDWSVVAMVSLCDWRLAAGERCGFDLNNDWPSRNLKVHKRPWSPFVVTGRNLTGDAGGKEGHLCSFSSEVFETGREERVSWWIKESSVLALSNTIMVIQVILAKAVKILVVNWQESHLLGTYTFSYFDEACIQECIISPDSKLLLVRQNFHLRRVLGHMTSFDAQIRAIQVQDGLCQRLFVIDDYLAFNCFGSGMSFEPFSSSLRVVVVSSGLQALEDPEEGIRVYDLETVSIVQTAPVCTDRIVHHITHSPNGAFLAVLNVNMSMALYSAIFAENIQVLDAGSFEVIHTILMPYCGPLRPIHGAAFPIFSRNCSLLAVLNIDHAQTVRLYKLPNCELTLQHLCRRIILCHTPCRYLGYLPLPRSMIRYLNYCQPEYQKKV